MEVFLLVSFRKLKRNRPQLWESGFQLSIPCKFSKIYSIPTEVVKMYPHSRYGFDEFESPSQLRLAFEQQGPEYLDNYVLEVDCSPSTESEGEWVHRLQLWPHSARIFKTKDPLGFLTLHEGLVPLTTKKFGFRLLPLGFFFEDELGAGFCPWLCAKREKPAYWQSPEHMARFTWSLASQEPELPESEENEYPYLSWRYVWQDFKDAIRVEGENVHYYRKIMQEEEQEDNSEKSPEQKQALAFKCSREATQIILLWKRLIADLPKSAEQPELEPVDDEIDGKARHLKLYWRYDGYFQEEVLRKYFEKGNHCNYPNHIYLRRISKWWMFRRQLHQSPRNLRFKTQKEMFIDGINCRKQIDEVLVTASNQANSFRIAPLSILDAYQRAFAVFTAENRFKPFLLSKSASASTGELLNFPRPRKYCFLLCQLMTTVDYYFLRFFQVFTSLEAAYLCAQSMRTPKHEPQLVEKLFSPDMQLAFLEIGTVRLESLEPEALNSGYLTMTYDIEQREIILVQYTFTRVWSSLVGNSGHKYQIARLPVRL